MISLDLYDDMITALHRPLNNEVDIGPCPRCVNGRLELCIEGYPPSAQCHDCMMGFFDGDMFTGFHCLIVCGETQVNVSWETGQEEATIFVLGGKPIRAPLPFDVTAEAIEKLIMLS